MLLALNIKAKRIKCESQSLLLFYFKILVQIKQPFNLGINILVRVGFFCGKCVFALCLCRFLFPVNEKEGIVNCPCVFHKHISTGLHVYRDVIEIHV